MRFEQIIEMKQINVKNKIKKIDLNVKEDMEHMEFSYTAW